MGERWNLVCCRCDGKHHRLAPCLGGRTILTFHGETGSQPIECEEWTCDLGAPGGWVVRGYLDPEYEDLPPMCPAPTPRAQP
jgi:hypothetical protein